MEWNDKNLINVLRGNGVVVMPTDTIYGIVGRAEDVTVVERIYRLRKRAPDKPCIILIGDIGDLKKFSVVLSDKQKNILKEYWSFGVSKNMPSPVSIVFDCFDESLTYLHRGTHSLAFRLPASQSLIDLLTEVGPLIAPSANIEGDNPARNIDEAKKYFGNLVDLYLDGGNIDGKASRIIKMNQDDSVSVIRE